MRLSITHGGHEPDLPFMVVDGRGFLLDLDPAKLKGGQLFDRTNVASIAWGVTPTGAEGGYVRMKDGTGRAFYDRDLLKPYLDLWYAQRDVHDAAIAQAPT